MGFARYIVDYYMLLVNGIRFAGKGGKQGRSCLCGQAQKRIYNELKFCFYGRKVEVFRILESKEVYVTKN